jgi:mono/diheme cytochrome c family protein
MLPKTTTALKWSATITGFAVLLLQLVPYGRAHDNPAVLKEPDWARRSTRELAARACFDCHSNETEWPWYSHLAPASWLVQRHVDEGRRVLNFSEWNRRYEEADESAEAVLGGEMPPSSYLVAHPSARLSAAERQTLAHDLAAMTGTSTPKHGERDD